MGTNFGGVHVWCHCWAPLLGAIAGCHGGHCWVIGVSLCWVPLWGVMAGCHCWAPLLGWHCGVLLGAIAGCAIAGCHCGAPWLDAIAGWHGWMPLLGGIAGC